MKFIYLLILFGIILFLLTNTFSNFNNTELFTNDDINVYVINMKKNTERLNNFMVEYNKSDLKNKEVTIFPAVVGKDIDLINYVTPEAYKQILNTEVLKNRKLTKRIKYYIFSR
jgi:hypothetical protein